MQHQLRSGPCPSRRRAAAAVSAILAAVLLLPAAARAQSAPEYVIGPRDVLAVTVANEPSLSGRFTVVADGTLSFPLLGTLKVGGLSPAAVERELTTRLADGYLERPVVSVVLEQFASQRVLVVGEVNRAASYPLTGRTTVLEMLLQAGAPTPNAASEALLVRTPPDDPSARKVQTINLRALQQGDLSQNAVLQSGDMLFVPRAEAPLPVYVTGQVSRPGAYTLPRGAIVLHALAQAGGITSRGSTGRIRIVRMLEDGSTVEVKVKPEDAVMPGDTVVVGRRLF
ncbi:MAG TPA: SLBB domain-containing protein [Vicinamibacterales bacterium]